MDTIVYLIKHAKELEEKGILNERKLGSIEDLAEWMKIKMVL